MEPGTEVTGARLSSTNKVTLYKVHVSPDTVPSCVTYPRDSLICHE